MTWNDIKYEIADKLFAKELDEAYNAGIRIGAEYATRKISFRVNISDKELTKTQKIGHERAVEAIAEVKKEISDRTGALL